MEGWKQRNKGRVDKGKEELATVCYFLFPESLRWGTKMEGENERMKEEDAGRWKQMSKKDEDNEQMRKIKGIFGGDNGGDATEMVSKRENKGSKETENGRGSDGESGGRMLMGQGGRHMRGGSKMRRDDEEKKYTSK